MNKVVWPQRSDCLEEQGRDEPLTPRTCANGVITIPNVPTSGGGTTAVTVAAATNGLYLIDLGPGKWWEIGSQNFVATAGVNATLSNGFNGLCIQAK